MSKMDEFVKIKSPIELMDFLNSNIVYGFNDINNIPYYNTIKDSKQNYVLPPIDVIVNNGTGTCGDVVEVERYFFDKCNIKNNTYSVYIADNDPKLHCFLTFEVDNKLFLFEQSWKYYRGIRKFNNLNELLTEVLKRFIIRYDITEENFSMCKLVKYNKPNSYLNFYQYIDMLKKEKDLKSEVIENKEFKEVKYSGFKKI